MLIFLSYESFCTPEVTSLLVSLCSAVDSDVGEGVHNVLGVRVAADAVVVVGGWQLVS